MSIVKDVLEWWNKEPDNEKRLLWKKEMFLKYFGNGDFQVTSIDNLTFIYKREKNKNLSQLTLCDLVTLQTYNRWCLELKIAMIPKVLDELTSRMNKVDEAIKNKINQINFDL